MKILQRIIVLLAVFSFIESQSSDRRKELRLAAEKGYISVIRDLIEVHGVDINAKNNLGETALMLATRWAQKQAVEVLVELGADINACSDIGSALMMAASSGNFSIVEYLVEHGARVDVKDDNGNTALISAVRDGHLEIVTYLVAKGADVHVRDDNQNSLLMRAVGFRGRLDVVKYLVEQAGLDVNARNDDGDTVLINAVSGEHLEIVTYLVDMGADVHACNYSGVTVLMTAIESRSRRLSMIEYLVGLGVNVNIKNNKGETALMLSAQNGYLDIVRYLVEHRADIRVRDRNQNSILMLSVGFRGTLDLVKYLVDKGLDINAHNNVGDTILMNAVAHYNMDIIKYLIDNGADIQAQNNAGKTAQMIAVSDRHVPLNKRLEIFRYLEKVNVLQEYLKGGVLVEYLDQKPNVTEYFQRYLERDDLSEDEKFDKAIEDFEMSDDLYWRGQLQKVYFLWRDENRSEPFIRLLTEINPGLLPQLISYFKSREHFKNIVKRFLIDADSDQQERLKQILQAEERVDSEMFAPDAGPVLREAIANKISKEIEEEMISSQSMMIPVPPAKNSLTEQFKRSNRNL